MKKTLITFSFLILAITGFSQSNTASSTGNVAVVPLPQPVVVAVLPVVKRAPAKQLQEELPNSGVTTIKQINQLPLALEGTYQVILSDKDLSTDISPEILSEIERNRDAEEITYLIINEQVKIKILPFSLIRSHEFVPLKTYSYEN
jgi:hypothetical protein